MKKTKTKTKKVKITVKNVFKKSGINKNSRSGEKLAKGLGLLNKSAMRRFSEYIYRRDYAGKEPLEYVGGGIESLTHHAFAEGGKRKSHIVSGGSASASLKHFGVPKSTTEAFIENFNKKLDLAEDLIKKEITPVIIKKFENKFAPERVIEKHLEKNKILKKITDPEEFDNLLAYVDEYKKLEAKQRKEGLNSSQAEDLKFFTQELKNINPDIDAVVEAITEFDENPEFKKALDSLYDKERELEYKNLAKRNALNTIKEVEIIATAGLIDKFGSKTEKELKNSKNSIAKEVAEALKSVLNEYTPKSLEGELKITKRMKEKFLNRAVF